MKKSTSLLRKSGTAANDNILRNLAFDNSIHPNIITTISTGKIIIANEAACKLLGYEKKQLLTKTRRDIFAVTENSFKKMLAQRTATGQSTALVTGIKKSGQSFSCEITSSVFSDGGGFKKAIYTIADLSKKILKQKKIDSRKEKIVADNIVLAQIKSDTRLEENNEWIKYIAKASYDVMWDWDIATNHIYVGDSIEEVFGYKVLRNTVTLDDFKDCLLPEEKTGFEKKLMSTLASASKSWSDAYMFKRYDGSIASTVSRASIIRNEDGKAIRLIGAIHDISTLEQMEKKLQEQITKHENDVKKEKLASDDIVLAKSKQKKIDTKKEKIVADNIVLAKSKQKEIDIKKEKIVADNIVLAKSKQKKIDIKKEKIVEDNIKLAQIKSDIRLAENNEEQSEKFLLTTKLSFDAIWDWNLLTNDFFLGEGFETLFGYAPQGKNNMASDWRNHLHADDKAEVEKGLQETIASHATQWEHAYRFIRYNGSVAKVFGRATIIRDAKAKARRMIGVIHDLSRQRELEEKLEKEIERRETQIAEATDEARESERSEIGRELHDNVNQLLGASKLYLNMAKLGGANHEMFLSRSSEYTLMAIEEIRKLTKGLASDMISNLGLCEAIRNSIQDIMEVEPVKIFFTSESSVENRMNIKFKLNVFRIVQEQLNNIIKHAKATEITISLSHNKKLIFLTISDNGVGFDTVKKSKGIGLSNIISRAKLYNGTANFISQPGKGCSLDIAFSWMG